LTALIITAVIIIALVILKVTGDRKRAERKRLYFKNNFGKYPAKIHSKGQMDALVSALARRLEKKEENIFSIDGRTWDDLTMQELFDRIDCCRTGYGMQALYEMLTLMRFDDIVLRQRDEIANVLRGDETLRTEVQMILEEMSERRFEPLDIKLETLSSASQSGVLVSFCCLALGITSSVLIFCRPVAGFVVFLAALFINCISYIYKKKKYTGAINCYGDVVRLIRNGKSLGEKIKGYSSVGGEFGNLTSDISMRSKELLPITRGAFLLSRGRNATGGLADLILDYLRMFLHLDLILFHFLQKEIESKSEELINLSTQIGLLDAMTALASFRENLSLRGGYCVPCFAERGLTVEGLYHPLVDNCVENDLSLDDSMLLTGSNASGKSTFLRSSALSVVLAQTLYTVPAKKYGAGFFCVASSMGISDNLLEGDSYYLSEIKSIRRILDYSEAGQPLLCVIDEVLKGTNTAERVSASAEILLSLAGKCTCLAATHDLELADILSETYENYHFAEMIDGQERIVFPYKLEKGVCHSRNAIALLRLMGYPAEITERAEKRCIEFLKRSGDFT